VINGDLDRKGWTNSDTLFLSVVGPGSGNVSSFDIWGSNLSLVTSVDTMKIDIVVSEFGKTSDKKKSKTLPPSVAGNKGSRNCGNLNVSFQTLAVYSRVFYVCHPRCVCN
jgi:hypothetical protein